MDRLLPIVVAGAAGWAAVSILVAIWRGLALRGYGAVVLGGLGGMLTGALKGHVLGGHHHVPGMVMTASPDLSSLAASASFGAVGAMLLLFLAALLRRLIPD